MLTDAEIDAKAEDWLNVSAAATEAKLFRDFSRAIEAAATAPLLARIAELEAAIAAERERICEAIKAEDDHCADGDYMMDSDDCIKVVRGTWERPDWNGANTVAPHKEN